MMSIDGNTRLTNTMLGTAPQVQLGEITPRVRVKLFILTFLAYSLWGVSIARLIYHNPREKNYADVLQATYLAMNIIFGVSVLKDDPVLRFAHKLLAKLRCNEGGMYCLLPYSFICGLQALVDLLNYGDIFSGKDHKIILDAPVICFIVGFSLEVILTFLSCSVYAELRRASVPPLLDPSAQIEQSCSITPFTGRSHRISFTV